MLNNVLIQGRGKESKMVGEDLVFSHKEAKSLFHLNYNALVVILQITNTKVHRISMDTESSLDILLMDAWKKMRLRHPLISWQCHYLVSLENPYTWKEV